MILGKRAKTKLPSVVASVAYKEYSLLTPNLVIGMTLSGKARPSPKN